MNFLIAGVYGVGKTFTCELIKKTVQIPVFRASQLIKHSIKNKTVKDVRQNQSLLIKAVSDINQKHPDIIIDGHFCLLNNRNEIQPIDVNVFEALKIKRIILLHDDVTEIEKRLCSRDGSSAFKIELIEEMQKTEIEHANYVSKELGIPMLMYDVKNQRIEEIIKFINF